MAGVLPHGGDHETRSMIARKLLNSARKGNVTLGALTSVAQQALIETKDGQKAVEEMKAKFGPKEQEFQKRLLRRPPFSFEEERFVQKNTERVVKVRRCRLPNIAVSSC